MNKSKPARWAGWLWAATLLAACNAFAEPDRSPDRPISVSPPPATLIAPPAGTSLPSSTLSPLDTTTSVYPTEWREVHPGVYFRLSSVAVGEWMDRLALLRIDPARAEFRVRYAPDMPQTVRDWHMQTLITEGAVAVINAGFFNANNENTGLLITDGQTHGQSYRGFGGMFFIQEGRPSLIWLAEQPYQPDSHITQAVQSFPMLVRAGRALDGVPNSGRPSRRSFVGIDRQGWVILGVTTMPIWSLTALADYLAGASDLALDSALNLDGGGSAGMWVRGVADGLLVNSIDPVPAVIVVIPRR
ncbi:MAG: phosphodiester glycosidase family protein [Anaerolineae bacterium]|nr:phosphodiester glycosidase family protein [Thermoflexales bacterium]MDW8406418.1 phosphodiester glycosidase family protein [Anaerolineae bacterium]